jgi:hypothetical protein
MLAPRNTTVSRNNNYYRGSDRLYPVASCLYRFTDPAPLLAHDNLDANLDLGEYAELPQLL